MSIGPYILVLSRFDHEVLNVFTIRFLITFTLIDFALILGLILWNRVFPLRMITSYMPVFLGQINSPGLLHISGYWVSKMGWFLNSRKKKI